MRTGILTNLTDGGEGMSGISEERRQKLRERMTGSGSPTFGIGHSLAAKQKISESQINRIAKYGANKHSEQWKQKLREDNPGGKSLRKKVVKINRDGYVVATYKSVNDTIQETGISRSYIQKSLRPNSYACMGYLYRHSNYELSSEELSSCFQSRPNKNFVGICKINLDGDIIETYDTLRQAATANPTINYHAIRNAARNGKTCGGFYWKKSQSFCHAAFPRPLR
jgi:hypothetical protein